LSSIVSLYFHKPLNAHLPEPDAEAAGEVDAESDGQPDDEFLKASGLAKEEDVKA